jgi:hypothetical protein
VLGVVFAVALVCTAVAVAAGPPNLANALKVFHRAHHAYDNLPAAGKPLVANVTVSRRVATAEDAKKHKFFVYVTQMKNKSACIVLFQGTGYSSHCKAVTLLFDKSRHTTSVTSGLIGGVAQNDVKKIVLAGKGGKRKVIGLTSDNGYLWGCPAPGNCAKWVDTVLGYNAKGKLVSRESIQ